MVTQPEKQDPRIVRTKQAIRQALLELIDEQGYQQISVKSIAERAGLNRTTFYLHYQNKEDLLISEFSILWDHLQAAFPLPAPHLREETAGLNRDFLIEKMKQLKKYRPIYKAMAVRKGAPVFKRQLIQYQLRKADKTENFPEPQSASQGLDRGDALAYMAAAYLGLLEWWLENECNHSPAQLADLLIKLYRHSPAEMLVWLTGPDQPNLE